MDLYSAPTLAAESFSMTSRGVAVGGGGGEASSSSEEPVLVLLPYSTKGCYLYIGCGPVLHVP